MISEIIQLQSELSKKEYMKVVCRDDKVVTVLKGDTIERVKGSLMKVHKANGYKVMVNVRQVIMVCVVEALGGMRV